MRLSLFGDIVVVDVADLFFVLLLKWEFASEKIHLFYCSFKKIDWVMNRTCNKPIVQYFAGMKSGCVLNGRWLTVAWKQIIAQLDGYLLYWMSNYCGVLQTGSICLVYGSQQIYINYCLCALVWLEISFTGERFRSIGISYGAQQLKHRTKYTYISCSNRIIYIRCKGTLSIH